MTEARDARSLIPARLGELSKAKENGERILRRSPRNLPDALKEKEKKPNVERDPDVSTLPPIVFEGRINYANEFSDIAMACDDLLQRVEKSEQEIVPLGFDLEWPFSFKTGSGKTALAQICADDKVCYLLHIYDLKTLPAALVVLLAHPKVRLVGVNIKNDVWKLGRDFKEFPAKKVVDNNCLDCGVFTNVTLSRSCRWSMERLTAYLLRKQISKDPEVRKSKWHIQPLSDKQKSYAATDAYVSLLLYITVQKRAEEIALQEQEKDKENVGNAIETGTVA